MLGVPTLHAIDNFSIVEELSINHVEDIQHLLCFFINENGAFLTGLAVFLKRDHDGLLTFSLHDDALVLEVLPIFSKLTQELDKSYNAIDR